MNTHTLLRVVFMLTLLFSLNSCSDSDEKQDIAPTLMPTPANIAGTWMLTQWNDAPLPQGTYLYISFNRRERSFTMYQKFDSMYARRITGIYSIEQESNEDYVISGVYDYGTGEWNNSYIITELSASGSMIWTAKENPADICVYTRCDAVPQEILDEAGY